MILELKDKIVKGEGTSSETLIRPDNNADIEEATIALTTLGFSKPNVNKAIIEKKGRSVWVHVQM